MCLIYISLTITAKQLIELFVSNRFIKSNYLKKKKKRRRIKSNLVPSSSYTKKWIVHTHIFDQSIWSRNVFRNFFMEIEIKREKERVVGKQPDINNMLNLVL
jgi:hypothetical protein